jgi:hypothetical protein
MSEIEINFKEVYRYLGYRGVAPDEQTEALVATVAEKVRAAARPVHGRRRVPIEWHDRDAGRFSLGRMEVKSRDLAKNLDGCSEAYMFAATLGMGIDMMIRRAELKSMIEASVIQAVSAALTEGYCDSINKEINESIRAEGLYPRPRYSPGFGDFGLEYQPEFLDILAAQKEIGIKLTDGLLMIPSKSVTALIGISDRPRELKK